MIKVKYNDIHDTVQIGNNVSIECETIKIGKYSRIGNNVKIKCREIEIGEHFFMADGVEIGRGGCTGPNSNVKIGNGVGIFENTIIRIGKNVWLPARSIVLPNVTIGNDVVIGINSIINRDLPSGCFAAGSPCKVIKENVYPKN